MTNKRLRRRKWLTLLAWYCVAAGCLSVQGRPVPQGDDEPGIARLAAGFARPGEQARPWVYWWWLNGYVSRDGIVRDLEAMQRDGIGGALVFHAGQGRTPGSTVFMSQSWRQYFRFAVEQAARRGIVIGLNLCGGWNAGGPWVRPSDAAKQLLGGSMDVTGPKDLERVLPRPEGADATYRDVAVLAWPVGPGDVLRSEGWQDISRAMDEQGLLRWRVPSGRWRVVRFGWRVCPRAHTKCTGGERYLEIDPLSAGAMDRHFAATAKVVISDVPGHVGKTFKYVHIDSGEIGNPDWTEDYRRAFTRLRGYDPFPYLAARLGSVVDSPAVTQRFLEDDRRSIGDLMVACYYGRLARLARAHGLGTHSEAAGYQKPTVDALRALGCNDICMSEFWSRRSRSRPYIHQLAEVQLAYHDGIRNAASAAHIYGRGIVQAEAFTVIRSTNYDRAPFDLKDIGDRAFCAGLNRCVLHQYISQADERARPGYVWPNIGTEFDRHATWWPMGRAWLEYLARCQYMLQQGRFVADVCYFQGEQVPVYVPARWAMNPPLPPGYDCDTLNAEVLLERAEAGPDGRLVLPDGQSYRYLVLWQGGRWQRPPRQYFGIEAMGVRRPVYPQAGSGKALAMTPAVLRKIKELVEAGVTLVGPRPVRSVGLSGYPQCDEQVARLADALWGRQREAVGRRRVGKGRVIWGRSLAEVMQEDRLLPDVEIHESASTRALPAETFSGIPSPGTFDWIHRSIDGVEIYFIANLRNAPASGRFVFRVAGKMPLLWDAVTGRCRPATAFTQRPDGRTELPLALPARGSLLVVFGRSIPPDRNGTGESNRQRLEVVAELGGRWEVRFDPAWGGPASVRFDRLVDWTQRPEPGIRYYSGKATYHRRFDLPADPAIGRRSVYLDLGTVHNIAAVRLNGRPVGVAWTAPWQVDVTAAVRPEDNHLEITVANLWANRLIGDASLPPEQRLTTTNVTRLTGDSPLQPSGLLGPVRLLVEQEQ